MNKFTPPAAELPEARSWAAPADAGILSIGDVTADAGATLLLLTVKVGPPVHNYEHEAGSYGDGFT